MARRTFVTLEDDLDGGPADETLRFGVDGSDYEIDLNTKNAAALHRLLAPFVARARKAGSNARRPVRTAASRRRSHDIRIWAKEQGIDLSDRGRIPASVVDKYEAMIGGTSRDPLAGRPRRRRRLADGMAYPRLGRSRRPELWVPPASRSDTPGLDAGADQGPVS